MGMEKALSIAIALLLTPFLAGLAFSGETELKSSSWRRSAFLEDPLTEQLAELQRARRAGSVASTSQASLQEVHHGVR